VAEELFVPEASLAPPVRAVAPLADRAWQTRYRWCLIAFDLVVVVLALAGAQFVKLGTPDASLEFTSTYLHVFSYY
jgi:hypothetical protein